MILIADGGSTKTQWILTEGQLILKAFSTAGINPFYQNSQEIIESQGQEIKSLALPVVDNIFYYGAGCANDEKNNVVRVALQQLFTAGSIFVASDQLGATRALCQHTPGIACILGTGSNSCFYDGTQIVANVSPLGYILGDEGSGAVLGKKLIADLLKNQLSPSTTNLFFDSYKLTTAEIMDSVYRKPFPNRYLAQFTKFLSQHIHLIELENIVLKSFDEFIVRNVKQYPQSKNLEIYFTGSIAFYFKEQLLKTLQQHHMQAGKIIKAPLNDLVKYHKNYNI